MTMASSEGKSSEESEQVVLPPVTRRMSRIGSINLTPRRSMGNVEAGKFKRRASRVSIDTGVSFPPLTGRRPSISYNRGMGAFRRPSVFGMLPALGQPKPQVEEVEPEPSYFDELPEKLPKTPRFCATLSTEAQYAMLKGYEDVLFSKITEDYPETDGELLRTETPARTGLASRRKSARVTSGDVNTGQSLSGKKTNTSTEKIHVELSSGRERDTPKTKDMGRRMVSYRFQNAMDILDTVKASRGHMLTSKPDKKPQIHPLKGYNYWSRLWSKDFKFKQRRHAHKTI